jgi:hypothetical protein
MEDKKQILLQKFAEAGKRAASDKPVVAKRQYWYITDLYCCVICGKEKRYITRVYNESEKSTKWYNDLCWEHKP